MMAGPSRACYVTLAAVLLAAAATRAAPGGWQERKAARLLRRASTSTTAPQVAQAKVATAAKEGLYINCGGEAFTDNNGKSWLADDGLYEVEPGLSVENPDGLDAAVANGDKTEYPMCVPCHSSWR